MTDIVLRQRSGYGYLIFGRTARGRQWVRSQLLEFQTLPLQIAVVSLAYWRAKVVNSGLTHTHEPFISQGGVS